MALAIKSIPILHGKAAAMLYAEAENNAKTKSGTIDFSAQVSSMKNIISKSKTK